MIETPDKLAAAFRAGRLRGLKPRAAFVALALSSLRSAGRKSTAEAIALDTGLSVPTVTRGLAELRAADLVPRTTPGRSTPPDRP